MDNTDTNPLTTGNSSSTTPMVTNVTSNNPPSLNLINPDTILSGTNRGTQFVGSSTLQIDSTNNIINISDPTTAGGGVLKLGVVATGGYLGLVVSDGKTDILFAGREADGSIVVKVAQTGFDAKTATGDQLIFNSNQDVFKIVASFTINNNFSIPDTDFHTYLITQPHGLNYVPAYQAFITLDNNLTLLGSAPSVNAANPSVVDGALGGNIAIFTYATVSVDLTNIYFNIDVAHYSAVTVSNAAKVYLLQESIN